MSSTSPVTFRERVSIVVDGGVADVRMTRADKRNALDGDMFLGLAEAGEWLKSAGHVRVAVLSGEGSSFCAGLDFATMGALAGGGERPTEGNPGEISAGRITHLGQQVCWVWQELEVPVIAAVHGHALGGGLQIALGADIRIAHPDTKMSVMEIKWGLVPDMSGTQTLRHLVRLDVAKELTFTGRMVSGTEAVALGLATRIHDDPRAEALRTAHEIAGRNPEAVQAAKRLLDSAGHVSLAEGFAAEERTIRRLIGSPNQKEAVHAWFEKRPAQFSDPQG